MATPTLDGHYGRSVQVDWCASCAGFWFDGNESIALSPGAVLRLFALIHEKPAESRAPLPDTLTCPRCRKRLVRTADMQRGTRFQYFRCPGEHGRFIASAEFLREKNFVRPLAPAELAELRRRVTQITCSSCGAPVDLTVGSACAHCRAPVSMLDPDQVQATVQQLQRAEEKRKTEDPALAARLLVDRLSVDRLFRDRSASSIDLRHIGLVEAGIAAVAGLFAALD